MYKSKITTTIKYAVFLLFLICVFQKPQEASAQVIQGNNVKFTLGTEIDIGSLGDLSDNEGWIYIYDNATGNKYVYVDSSKRTSVVNIYASQASGWREPYFTCSTNLWGYQQIAGESKWTTDFSPASTNYSTGIAVSKASNLYVVGGGTTDKITFDGVVIWNPLDSTPTPTVPPSPTPIPIAGIDANDAGLADIFDAVMRIMNIPFSINGYEVTFLQIFIYIALASGVLVLIFGGTRD